MAEKKQESFVVTDRRLFTAEGELRQETHEEEQVTPPPVASECVSKLVPAATRRAHPPLPATATRPGGGLIEKSSEKSDARVELSGRDSAKQ